MTNSGLISPQRESLLVSKSKWMDCIRVQKSSDTTLPQTQAKNAVRQYFRIIAHQKCQEALQCQEQKEKKQNSMYTSLQWMMSVGLVLVWVFLVNPP